MRGLAEVLRPGHDPPVLAASLRSETTGSPSADGSTTGPSTGVDPSGKATVLTRTAWACFAFAALAQLAWALLPIDVLVERVTLDDTFLYLQVAWNHARTGVPSFDGVEPTNGFQILWEPILVSLAWLTGDREATLRGALLVGAVLNLLAGLAVRDLAGRFFARRLAADLALVSWSTWLLFPVSNDGMESALHAAVFALACAVTASALTPRSATAGSGGAAVPATGVALLLGALWALNALVRLDSGMISAFVALYVVALALRQRQIGAAAAFVAIPLIAIASMVVIQETAFGTATPVSGQAKLHWVWHATPGDGAPIPTAVRGIASAIAGSLLRVVGAAGTTSLALAAVAAVPVALGLLVAARARRWLAGYGLALLLGLGAHLALNNVLLQRFGSSYWYYQPLRVCLAAALGGGLAALFARLLAAPSAPSRRIATSLAVALVVWVALAATNGVLYLADRDPGGMNAQRLRAALWLATDELPDDAVCASWNAGTLAWFGAPRRVVNLDGLVQTRAFLDDVLRPGDPETLRRYLHDAGITHVVDYDAEDFTQTYGVDWDHETRFRAIVPRDRCPTVARFGTIEVVDVRGW
jgi:hypothetical protein